MAVMKFGKQASGGSGEQTLEQTEAWNRLARRFRKNGGAGVALDFRMKVVGIKTPHEVSFTKDGKKTITAWGEDRDGNMTADALRFKTVLDRQGNEKQIPMKPGVLITLEMVEERFAGLRHYKDGTYSGNELTAIYQLGNAIYRGQLDKMEVDPEVDFMEREVIVTVEADREHDRTTVDGAPVKGGFWWKVTGFKPVPVGDDDDDDDEPVAAPVARSTPAAVAVPGDDDDVPF